MLRFPFLSRVIFPLAFLFLFYQNGLSQESRPFRYSNEIGVDFAPFLRGEPGLSLLYKRSLSQTAGTEKRRRLALRVLLGYYESSYGYSNLRKQILDTTYWNAGSGRTNDRFISGGVELQIRKNKFRWHIGADLGYRYSTSLGNSENWTQVNGIRTSSEEFEHKNKYNIAEGAILAGLNYFFLPRFSVGVEVDFSLAVEFSKSKVLQNGSVLYQDHGTLIEVGPRLKLLHLSYHFGKPPQAASSKN